LQILVKAVRNVKKFGGGHILRRIYGWQNSARRNFFGGQIFGVPGASVEAARTAVQVGRVGLGLGRRV